MVYILSAKGQPLMPTENHAKVRRLLKENKAKVVKRCPFTVQLLYDTTIYTQPVSLGVDAGSKHIGVSATTKDKVLYEADIELRNDVTNLNSVRRELRHSRRNRKTRYRPARFKNRKISKGWLPPSTTQKIETHLTVIRKIHAFLPVTNIVVECASFDIQKIKNPKINGTEYQCGEQFDFWNVREYVLCRDNHTCQCCKGKSGDKVLNVHHIESRKTGGNAPNNLATLCETCHKKYHQGKIELPPFINRGHSYRDAEFMTTMRWAFYEKLKYLYQNVDLTFGYKTKKERIANGLPKEHYIDARCISGNPKAKPLGFYFYQKKIRCHNRQIHKMIFSKGGYRKNNQAEKYVFGYQLYDKVLYKNQEWFIWGRRKVGSFDIRKLNGEKARVLYKKLKFIEPRTSYLTERRVA